MTDNEDLKAKMREALERKKPHDAAEGHQDHPKEKAAGTHGPAGGGDKQFRRKAGP